MRRLIWVTVLAGAGCFSKPEFAGWRDGGPDDAAVTTLPTVEVTELGGTVTVRTPAYALRFDANGWLMPESLTFSGSPSVERLGLGHPFNESGLGISLYNVYGVNVGDQAAGGQPTRQIRARGPAMASVEIAWAGPPMCPMAITPTGTTGNVARFTFFPDGRVVRHDVLHTTQTCTVTLGTINTFAWSTLPALEVQWPDAPESFNFSQQMIPADAYTSRTTPLEGWACLRGEGNAVGFTWRPIPGPTVPPEWEMVEVGRYASGLVHFGYYWAEQLAPEPTHQYVADTALFFRADNPTCADLAVQMRAYQAPPTIAGAAYQPPDGTYLFPVAGSYPAQADVPAGFAIAYPTSASAIQLVRSSGAPARGRELVAGDDYLVQFTASVATVFVRDRLDKDEALEIADR